MRNVRTGDYIKIIKASPFDEEVGIRLGNVKKVESVIGDTVYISAGYGGAVSLSPTQYTKMGEESVKEHFENIEKLKIKRELMLTIISIIEESVYHSTEDAIETFQKAKIYLDELIVLEKEILVKEMKTKDEQY